MVASAYSARFTVIKKPATDSRKRRMEEYVGTSIRDDKSDKEESRSGCSTAWSTDPAEAPD